MYNTQMYIQEKKKEGGKKPNNNMTTMTLNFNNCIIVTITKPKKKNSWNIGAGEKGVRGQSSKVNEGLVS